MLRVNEGPKKRCMRMIMCVIVLSAVNMLSASPVVQGDGDAGDQEPLESPARISIVTGSEEVSYPAIWGNYVVWKGAVNEVYAIDQNGLVPMPGLKINGVPAIWENIVVWEGSEQYYDLDAQTLQPLNTMTVGANPAISCGKIVWDNSLGFYGLGLGTMVYPYGLQIGDSPDIDEDRIVWSKSQGYYDIGKRRMMQPRGLEVGLDPAIHGQRITWSYLNGGYYDLELETYGHAKVVTGRHLDLFDDQVIWLRGLDALNGPAIVWNLACGGTAISGHLMWINRVQSYEKMVVYDQDTTRKKH